MCTINLSVITAVVLSSFLFVWLFVCCCCLFVCLLLFLFVCLFFVVFCSFFTFKVLINLNPSPCWQWKLIKSIAYQGDYTAYPLTSLSHCFWGSSPCSAHSYSESTSKREIRLTDVARVMKDGTYPDWTTMSIEKKKKKKKLSLIHIWRCRRR